MPNKLDKFFDPATLPGSSTSTKEVDIFYFRTIRTKLKLSFALLNNPTKIYAWDYPLADILLDDSFQAGAKVVLVDKALYDQKVKELANL